MRKILKKAGAFLLIAVMVAGMNLFTACDGKNAETITFEPQATVEANIGSYFDIPVVKALNAAGERVTLDIKVKDGDGNYVGIDKNTFFVSSTKDYTVFYTYTDKNNINTVKKTIVKVIDSLRPVIDVPYYTSVALVGETVCIPKVFVSDNSGLAIVPEIKVLNSVNAPVVLNEQKVSKTKTITHDATPTTPKYYEYIVEEFDNFTVSADHEKYTIQITAKDAAGTSSEKNIIVFVKQKNVLDDFDTPESLSSWEVTEDIYNNAQLSYNEKAEYVKSGTGSLMVFSPKPTYSIGSWPKIKLNKSPINSMIKTPAVADDPATTDVNEAAAAVYYHSFYFWVYNDSSFDIIVSCVADIGIAYAKSWTMIEFTITEMDTLTDWSGKKFNKDDFGEGIMIFFTNPGDSVSLYFDEFRIRETATAPIISMPEGSATVAFTDVEFTVPQPIAVEGVTYTYKVLDSKKNEIKIAENNKHTFVKPGVHMVMFTAKNADGIESTLGYKFTVVVPSYAKNEFANNVSDFECITAYGGTISENKDYAYIKTDTASIANKGFPGWGHLQGFKIANPKISNLNTFKDETTKIAAKGISFWVYNAAAAGVNTVLKNGTDGTGATIATLPGAKWTKIMLSLEKLTELGYNTADFKNFAVTYLDTGTSALYFDTFIAYTDELEQPYMTIFDKTTANFGVDTSLDGHMPTLSTNGDEMFVYGKNMTSLHMVSSGWGGVRALVLASPEITDLTACSKITFMVYSNQVNYTDKTPMNDIKLFLSFGDVEIDNTAASIDSPDIFEAKDNVVRLATLNYQEWTKIEINVSDLVEMGFTLTDIKNINISVVEDRRFATDIYFSDFTVIAK